MALFKCQICHRNQFVNQKAVTAHIRQKHPRYFPEYFNCVKCHAEFPTATLLVSHLRTRTHQVFERLKCDTCGRRFSYKKHLDSHVRREHKVKVELLFWWWLGCTLVGSASFFEDFLCGMVFLHKLSLKLDYYKYKTTNF